MSHPTEHAASSLDRSIKTVLFSTVLLASAPLSAQQIPYSLPGVRELLRGSVPQPRILEQLIEPRCVDFRPSPEADNQLRQAGATPATLQGIRDACRILVDDVRMISPPDTLKEDASTVVSFVARYENGLAVPSSKPFVWSTSDPSVLGVSRSGRWTAVARGSAVVTLTIDGAPATHTVVVAPVVAAVRMISPPETLLQDMDTVVRFEALDRNGLNIPDARPVTWSVSDTTVLRVSDSGRWTARSPGPAEVTLEVDGVQATHDVSVVARVAELEISPSEIELTVGETDRLEVQPLGPGRVPLSTPVQISSDDPRILEVRGGDLVVARQPGRTIVRVTSQNVSELVPAVVLRRVPTSVSVTPSQFVLEIGDSVALTALPLAADGTDLSDRQIDWSNSAPDVLSVTSNGTVGTVRGVQPGPAVVSATSEGAVGRAQVVVLPSLIDKVLVSGIFPGGGQFRVGRPGRGALTLLGAAGAFAAGYLVTEKTQFCAARAEPGASCPAADVARESVDRPNLVLGIAGGVAVWLLSAFDAKRHGDRLNEAAQRIRDQPWADVVPLAEPGRDGSLSVAWRIRVH